ncbi:hypothetical protein EV175_003141 [Coemansia sp. RSA 1933]|nr:hypothetical protein EV175_003141 [Coemansia sp. RSA 1933]
MTELNLIQCEGMTPIEEPLPMENETKSSDYDGDAIERMDITMDFSDDPNADEVSARIATLFGQMFGPVPEICGSQVSLHRMSGALTNRVYIATIDPAPIVMAYRAPRLLRAKAEQNQQEMVQMPAKYIVRVYGKGSEELLCREKELYWLSQLSPLGIGPKMHGIFGNGRIEEYLESTMLNNDNVLHASTSRNVARRMCELHTLVSYFRPHGSGIPGDRGAEFLNGKAELWNKVDTGMQMIQDKWYAIRHKASSNAQCVELLDNWHKVEETVQKFRALVHQMRSPLVFTHNDLRPDNILRLESNGKIEIIDYEYASYNYRGFDIANHFCELMVDYGHPEHAHLLNLAKYPTEKQRYNYLRAYIRAKAFIDDNVKANAGTAKTDSAHPMKIHAVKLSDSQIRKEVEALDREVTFFVTATHLYWGIHGLAKAPITENSFDYIGHATQRLLLFQSQVAGME